MNDKCFCHLNGFAVKDATARNEIETIKTTYATKEYVDGNTFNETVLEPYATTEYVNAAINKIDLEPYATIEYVDGKEVHRTIIYNNTEGTNANFTLTDSINNYDEFEVYYRHGTCIHSTKGIVESGVNVGLEAFTLGDNALYIQNLRVNFNGTQATTLEAKNAEITKGSITTTNSASLKITRVVGIKY